MKRPIQFLVVFLMGLMGPVSSSLAQVQPVQERPNVVVKDSLAQAVPGDSVAAAGTIIRIKEASDVDTFWALARLGGMIAYIILMVLVIGIFIVVSKVVAFWIDWWNSRELRGESFGDRDVDKMKAMVQGSKNSTLKNILAHLIEFFDAGGDAGVIRNELDALLDRESKHFDTYRNRLSFIADAAGALGLLGTVWGIFQTFFGGNLEPEKILNGMGIALITTLFGLVVSLLINLAGTKLESSFGKRLDFLEKKGDELRLRLLGLAARQPLRVAPAMLPAAVAEAGNSSQGHFQPGSDGVEETQSPPPPIQERRKGSLHLLEPIPEKIATGEVIKNAIKLRAVDQYQKPIAKARVYLRAEGEVFLEKDQRTIEKTTDRRGRVFVNICGGEKVGSGAILYWLENEEKSKIKAQLTTRASKPAEVTLEGGNDQPGVLGKSLPEPFRVLVLDAFGNPVPNTDVLFKLVEGEGLFNGGQRKHVAQTDGAGYAEAEFTLGSRTGFHTVYAEAKDGKAKHVEFRILSRPVDEEA